MGLFDFLKKDKPLEEQYQEALSSKDYLQIVKLGKNLLKTHPNSLSILNSYTDALLKLGKKKEALKTLIDFAERKIREEYYDMAIALLKKAERIDPLNIKALKLLSVSYQKKELYYEAFKLLLDAYKSLSSLSKDTSQVERLIEKLLEENFHPLFYEKYGDFLASKGKTEEALKNFVLAGNMYLNLKDYVGAFRTLLKARNIKRTTNLDRQLLEAISKLSDHGALPVLTKLLEENQELDFFKFAINLFSKSENLELLKNAALHVSSPKIKYLLLSLIANEEGEIEESKEHLYKLKLLDENFYNGAVSMLSASKGEILQLEKEKELEELPSEEDVISALENTFSLNESLADYLKNFEPKERDIPYLTIDEEVKRISKDDLKNIAVAEAMFGLGNYEEAIKNAEKVLNNPQHFLKALSIIVLSYKALGEYHKAISLLTEILERENLSEKEKAKVMTLLGEVYEGMGEEERALLWYREANKELNEEELSQKIKALSEKL